MALHIQCYPSAYQLKKLFNRYLFALGLDEAIVLVPKGCQQCAAVKDRSRKGAVLFAAGYQSCKKAEATEGCAEIHVCKCIAGK